MGECINEPRVPFNKNCDSFPASAKKYGCHLVFILYEKKYFSKTDINCYINVLHLHRKSVNKAVLFLRYFRARPFEKENIKPYNTIFLRYKSGN